MGPCHSRRSSSRSSRARSARASSRCGTTRAPSSARRAGWSTPSSTTSRTSSSTRPRRLAEAPQILVIEDDEATRNMLATALTRAGYRVALAVHGLDGLMQIDRASPKPQLLLVDIMIPELDGLSLVRALRTKPETRNIPVVFITAKTD